MTQTKRTIIFVVAACILGACSPAEPPASSAAMPAPPAAEAATIDLRASLAGEARSADDRARDAGRKPADVLELLGVKPGMAVIDLLAAGGWYSEVLSHAVGADGTVAAQNPPWMLAFRDGFYGNALDERLAGGRVANVSRLDASWAELAAASPKYDVAMSALNFHDAYYLVSPEDAAEMMSAVYTILKPGGVFGVIDHAGNPDGDNKSLHRIDKAIAIEAAKTAGFVVEADSSLLANPADDHTQGVFSEGLRGKTDRFLLKLRKPAG